MASSTAIDYHLLRLFFFNLDHITFIVALIQKADPRGRESNSPPGALRRNVFPIAPPRLFTVARANVYAYPNNNYYGQAGAALRQQP